MSKERGKRMDKVEEQIIKRDIEEEMRTAYMP